VQQTVGTAVTNYLWDEASQYGDVVLETDGSGATQASYVLGGDELLAQTRGGTTSYYLDDGQGNVRLLTTSSGAITDRYTYDAFGNLLSSTGSTINSYRYTGQQFDSLTGLYDLRARSYDPANGRFTSRDTASINFSNPVELNRYSYAQENPVNFTDPSGHGEEEVALIDESILATAVGRGATVGGIILTGEEIEALIGALLGVLLLLFARLGGNSQAISQTGTGSQQQKKRAAVLMQLQEQKGSVTIYTASVPLNGTLPNGDGVLVADGEAALDLLRADPRIPRASKWQTLANQALIKAKRYINGFRPFGLCTGGLSKSFYFDPAQTWRFDVVNEYGCNFQA
jgi:RHS repeat-associated protein